MLYLQDAVHPQTQTAVHADSGTAQDNSLQNVLDKGTFVLGLDDSFPPMGFRDENNNIVGFDIDVATEVANRMGVELKLQPIEWSTKEMELNTGSVDCLWNGLSIDDEKKTSNGSFRTLYDKPYGIGSFE